MTVSRRPCCARCCLLCRCLASRGHAQDRYASARENLLREIESDMRATARETGRPHSATRYGARWQSVPRERFVPPHLAAAAYENRPLPIGEGQTISQPFIVALMTELLQPKPNHVVLEVGTGSGYQAAVFAECVAQGVFDRDRRAAGAAGKGGTRRRRLSQRRNAHWRWLSGLARSGAV